MKRSRLAGFALLACAACGVEGYRGRADVAAEAGREQLAPAALSTWIARVPSRTPTVGDAGFTALTWIDYSLFATAAAAGATLTDSATAVLALAPDLTLIPLRHWHDTLVAHRPRVAADVPDTLFADERLRVFQEIFLRVRDPQDVRAITALRTSADSLLARARGGANFDSLARTRSQDPAGTGGGWLAPGRRSAFPPEFARTAWLIKPGEVGGVISRGGFHVVRRPALSEVRDRLRVYAESLATRKADSVYADSLLLAKGLTLGQHVPDRVRAFFTDPAVRVTDTAALARWVDGELRLRDAALWIDLLPARAYLDLRGASDVALERFVHDLGQQAVLLADARKHGVGVEPAEWTALFEGYRRAVGISLDLLGVQDGASLPASEIPTRVTALLDRFTTDSARYRALPSALGAVLRERSGYRLHDPGLRAAVAAVPTPPKP